MGLARNVNNSVGEMATRKILDVGEKPCTIILFCFYQCRNIKMDSLEPVLNIRMGTDLMLSLVLVLGMFCHHNVGLYL